MAAKMMSSFLQRNTKYSTTKNGVSLIVGSAPAARSLSTASLQTLTKISINNAWQIRDDFEYCVFPSEFPKEKRPPKIYNSIEITNDNYMPAINDAGGIIYCGATMAFATGYWASFALSSNIISFYACDMVYQGTRTHFYGTGAPDPLREDISLRSLEAKSVRLFAYALEHNVLLVNSSTEKDSRLVFPRLPIEKLTSLNYDLTRSHSWILLLDRYREIRRMEIETGLDARREDYWNIVGVHDRINELDEIDHAWLSLLPLIEQGWSEINIS